MLMVKSDGIRIKYHTNIIKSPYIPMFSPFFSPGSIGQKLMAIWAPNLQRLRAEIIIEVPPQIGGGSCEDFPDVPLIQ